MIKETNLLILHLKIYGFIEYIYPILNKYPTNERFALEQRTRNTIYDMLEECVAYMNSGSVSHLYTIDRKLGLLKDLFKLARDLGIKVIDANRIIVITTKLEEIGRILGGIIVNKQNKVAKSITFSAISYFNPRNVIIPYTYECNSYLPDYCYADQLV